MCKRSPYSHLPSNGQREKQYHVSLTYLKKNKSNTSTQNEAFAPGMNAFLSYTEGSFSRLREVEGNVSAYLFLFLPKS